MPQEVHHRIVRRQLQVKQVIQDFMKNFKDNDVRNSDLQGNNKQ